MNLSKLTLIALIFLWNSTAWGSDQPPEPLFDSTEPVELILEMDMEKVLNDKSEDPEYNPALLIQKISRDKIQAYNIKVKARGRTRRIKDVCEFPPLKLNFEKKSLENTLFEGQDKLKMVTHCQNSADYENFAVLEYLTYKTYNTLTDLSYRVRLVKVTYRDIKQNYPDIEKSGFLIEDDEAMAERVGGMMTDKRIWSPDSCRQEAVDLFSLFQFMIGNTDWWIHTRHNVDIVQLPNKELVPVPFDFDYAGIINAPYAVPAPSLPIEGVKERFFKGSCKSPLSYQEVINKFNSSRESIFKIVEETSFLDKRMKKNTLKYIEGFYNIINNEKQFDKYIHQTCDYMNQVPGQATIK